MISAAGPRRIFLLYAQKDKKYGDELFRHLKPMVESHAITLEGPHAIQAGEDKEHVLKQKLEAANWLIVLLSSDLLSSEAEASALRILSSIRDEEIENKSHQESASRIIPIYIRDVELGDTIFEPLQRLPRNGRSISSTKNRDKTWKGIVTELRTRFNDANSTPQGDQVFADMDDYDTARKLYDQGLYELAFEYFLKSAETHKQRIQKASDDLQPRLEMCAIYYWLGWIQFISGDYQKARVEFEAGVEMSDDCAKRLPDDKDVFRYLQVLRQELGSTLMELGELDRAEQQLLQSRDLANRLHNMNPSDPQYQRDVSVVHLRLGELFLRQRLHDDALKAFDESFRVAAECSEQDPANDRPKQLKAMAAIGRGDAFRLQGNQAQSLDAYLESEPLLQSLVTRDRKSPGWLHSRAILSRKMGALFRQENRISDAQREYATAAAALATVTARTGCIGWKTELIEIYALLWDGYHTNPPDDSLTHRYLVDRVHQLCHELEDSPKTSDAMKSRLQTLRTQYPSLFEESNAV